MFSDRDNRKQKANFVKSKQAKKVKILLYISMWKQIEQQQKNEHWGTRKKKQWERILNCPHSAHNSWAMAAKCVVLYEASMNIWQQR